MYDSDTTSHSGNYKYFKQITRDRLLYEMLGSTKKGGSQSSWQVLIMDRFTVKVMSYACKMADITNAGVSLVEDIYKRRQPLPTMDAIYFIQPSKENVVMFMSDMAGKKPLYKKAFVFFSSPSARELVAHIKKDATVLPRIGSLSEMNLEYFAFDRQGFVTDNERALEELFGDDLNYNKADAYLKVMAARVATAFASMRIAPVIHEWTYDAMCHDLLKLEGNKYVREVPSKTGGRPERKEVLLEEHDPIWFELRHLNIADVLERLHDKVINFVTKNKAASIKHSSRERGELSTRELHKMVQSLPQYIEQKEKLSLHAELARLSSDDMNAVNNMKLLGTAPEAKESSISALALNFFNKKKRGVRKERVGEETAWELSRFYLMVEELIEKLSKGELSKNEYPCMNDPSPTFHGTAHSAAIQYTETPVAHSMRSRRTPTWASRPPNSGDGYSSDSVFKHASSDFKKMGRRIFVIIVGGATRSELRACHKLSTKLNREIILGSSSIDEPPQFITKLKSLSTNKVSLDDLEI